MRGTSSVHSNDLVAGTEIRFPWLTRPRKWATGWQVSWLVFHRVPRPSRLSPVGPLGDTPHIQLRAQLRIYPLGLPHSLFALAHTGNRTIACAMLKG